MALIKCPECGKEISDKAKTCPKCGWKVNIDEIKKEEAKKDEVLPKKPIGIEASCFESNPHKSVLNNEKKIHEQAKENQDTRTELISSTNGEKDKSTHAEKELVKMASVESSTVVENDTIMKSDSVKADEIKKDRKDNKKGKIFKKIVIVVVVLIALGVWSVVLVKLTANMIVKNLDISIESIEVVESDKVVIPESTDIEVVEVDQLEESTNNIAEIEDVSVEEIEETQVDIEINDNDLVLENGIIINRETKTYNGDIYNIVNAKITDENDSLYEMGIIMNAKKIDSIFTTVKLQCLDEDGFEIKYFYINKPATIGEFTSSCIIPKETKKIQICSEK